MELWWNYTDRRKQKYSEKPVGRNSAVHIATCYGLDNSQWGARFSAPIQTGPGAHPGYCTMGTGPFPG